MIDLSKYRFQAGTGDDGTSGGLILTCTECHAWVAFPSDWDTLADLGAEAETHEAEAHAPVETVEVSQPPMLLDVLRVHALDEPAQHSGVVARYESSGYLLGPVRYWLSVELDSEAAPAVIAGALLGDVGGGLVHDLLVALSARADVGPVTMLSATIYRIEAP